VTTVEKAALCSAIVTALGVGALLKALFDHFLGRKARRVDLAEKSIRVADAAVSMADAQLTRAKEAIETLERELGELKAQAAAAPSAGNDSGQLTEVLDRVVEARDELRQLTEVVRSRTATDLGSAVALWQRTAEAQASRVRWADLGQVTLDDGPVLTVGNWGGHWLRLRRAERDQAETPGTPVSVREAPLGPTGSPAS
jgi:hypothetical protein